MRAWLGLAAALGLAGCSTLVAEREPEPVCPPGQEHVRTARLFFGQTTTGRPWLSTVNFQKFVDEEITPRFPDGLTVMEGGGEWRGSENQLIREAAKVVVIVLPRRGDAERRIEAVRAAYKARFQQDSGLLVTQDSCVAF